MWAGHKVIHESLCAPRRQRARAFFSEISGIKLWSRPHIHTHELKEGAWHFQTIQVNTCTCVLLCRSNDNDDTTKRKVNLVFEKIQTLKSRAAGSVQGDNNVSRCCGIEIGPNKRLRPWASYKEASWRKYKDLLGLLTERMEYSWLMFKHVQASQSAPCPKHTNFFLPFKIPIYIQEKLVRIVSIFFNGFINPEHLVLYFELLIVHF